MFAFIDSSVLCSDFHMQGLSFQLLKSSGMYIVLSEIVIAETKNKYRELLEEALRKTNAGIRDLQRLGFSAVCLDENRINEALHEYSEYIDFFIIESGMTIPEPYPEIAHNLIVERALARKKPFKSDGKNGYRDLLIWNTFLNFVKTCGNNEDFFFITLNKNDFSDDKDANKLHRDLLADIENMNLTDRRIRYYSSLNAFVEEVIKPRLKNIEEKESISLILLNDQEGFIRPIENYVSKKLAGFDLNGYDVFVDGENPEVTSFDDISIDDIADISKVSDNEYLITTKVDAYCTINSYLLKSEISAMTKKEVNKIDIANSEWNEHYALIENNVLLNIDIEVLLMLTESFVEIKSIEISDISDASYCPYCPSYDEDEEDDEE
ncbi:MAG TPA: PIN domain-containing protein [Patescibacteria group bacterium]